MRRITKDPLCADRVGVRKCANDEIQNTKLISILMSGSSRCMAAADDYILYYIHALC
jgi:hypothetical protein